MENNLFMLSQIERFFCVFKGIVHPKMKICCKCAHPQVIPDVDEFVEMCLCISVSAMDALQ